MHRRVGEARRGPISGGRKGARSLLNVRRAVLDGADDFHVPGYRFIDLSDMPACLTVVAACQVVGYEKTS